MEFNLNELNTNKEKRKQYIMNDLNDKLNWLKGNTNHDVFAIFLKGSQNYDQDIYTEEYKSDIDTVAIVVPSLEDVLKGKKMVSHTYELDDKSHIEVKDIRLMKHEFEKANFGYLELLFTEFYFAGGLPYINSLKELLNKANKIATMDMSRFLNATRCRICNKRKDLCKPRPSIKDKVDKYGYDGKQLSHMYRLMLILQNCTNGISYKDSLVPSKKYKQFLLDLKLNKAFSTVEDAVSFADEILEKSKELVDKYIEFNGIKEKDQKTLNWLDEFVTDVIKNKIVREIYKEFNSLN